MQQTAQLTRLTIDPKAALAIHRLRNRRASDVRGRAGTAQSQAQRHSEYGLLTLVALEAGAAAALAFLVFILHEGNPVLLAAFVGLTVAAVKDELRLLELQRLHRSR